MTAVGLRLMYCTTWLWPAGTSISRAFHRTSCLPQDKLKTTLGSKHSPWTLSVLHTTANPLDEQQWISELKPMQWGTPSTAAVRGWLQTPASITFGWHPQCPVAIKAGNFSQTHISTPPTNVTLIPVSWYPFPCFLRFPKLLCHRLHPSPAFPRIMGKRREWRC